MATNKKRGRGRGATSGRSHAARSDLEPPIGNSQGDGTETGTPHGGLARLSVPEGDSFARGRAYSLRSSHLPATRANPPMSVVTGATGETQAARVAPKKAETPGGIEAPAAADTVGAAGMASTTSAEFEMPQLAIPSKEIEVSDVGTSAAVDTRPEEMELLESDGLTPPILRTSEMTGMRNTAAEALAGDSLPPGNHVDAESSRPRLTNVQSSSCGIDYPQVEIPASLKDERPVSPPAIRWKFAEIARIVRVKYSCIRTVSPRMETTWSF